MKEPSLASFGTGTPPVRALAIQDRHQEAALIHKARPTSLLWPCAEDHPMTRAVFGTYRPPCTHDLNGRHPLIGTLLGAKSLICCTGRPGIIRLFIPPYVVNREQLTRLAARPQQGFLLP